MRYLLLSRASAPGDDDGLEPALAVWDRAGAEVVRRELGDGDGIGEGWDAVVVAGGDGSVRRAATDVIAAGVPLGILPTGTANDLATGLGIPGDLAAAAAVIAAGRVRAIDVGRVGDRIFVNELSMGLSVEILRRASTEAKERYGVLGYALELLDSFRDHEPFEATVEVDGVGHVLRSVQLTVGNGRTFGGGLVISDAAQVDDGVLDLCSMASQGLVQLLWTGRQMQRGATDELEAVEILRGKRFVIRTEPALEVSFDGDLAATTPLEIEVAPAALRVLVPGDDPGQSSSSSSS